MFGSANVRFAPEEIELVRQALELAWSRLSGEEQLHVLRRELAVRILKLVARASATNPDHLCDFALQKSRERAVRPDLAS